MSTRIAARKRGERGFSVMMIAVCAVVMFGMLGLTTDLGRVYVTKNELQAFADAASVAGALKLDGTADGLKKADATGTTGPSGPSGSHNTWLFSTQTVSSPTVTCSTSYGGSYDSCTSSPLTSKFVKVLASANVALYFMPVVPGIGTSQTVNAVATAGLRVKNTIEAGGTNGIAPFSPAAHTPSDPNFGYTVGMEYTMKWHGDDSPCAGDSSVNFKNPNGASDRGYIDIGQGNSETGLVDILKNNITYGKVYKVDDTVDWVPGNKNLGKGLDPPDGRFGQDTDTAMEDYATYKSNGTGNGRRLIIVPVNDAGGDNAKVIGFALFFLRQVTGKNSDPYCAEFVGTAKPGDITPGPSHGSGTEYYSVQLLN
jgi:Flp pilus assembly protein TadG